MQNSWQKVIQRFFILFGLLVLPLSVNATRGSSSKAQMSVDSIENCPAIGDAKSNAVQELNKLKNRKDNAPNADDIDSNVTMAALLERGDDEARFDSSKG